MVTPELKWPMTNFTPAAAKLLATETPCLGSPASSPTVEESFLPRMPPPSLRSVNACSAPCLICEPKAAFDPVIGPPTANLVVSLLPPPPQPARTRPAPTATPSVMSMFIGVSPGNGGPWRTMDLTERETGHIGHPVQWVPEVSNNKV